MKAARLITGKVCDASEVAHWSDGEREAASKNWTCLGCGAVAYFRRPSCDGHAALFGSRYHEDDCVGRSSPFESIEGTNSRSVVPTWNEGAILNLQLDGEQRARLRSQSGMSDPPFGTRSRRASSEPTRTQHKGITLAELLLWLKTMPGFSESRQLLKLTNGTELPVAEACVHADSYSGQASLILVWGTVRHANDGWLNAGRYGHAIPAIRLDEQLVGQLMARHALVSLRDLIGFDFIVEGCFRPTRRGIPFTSLKKIASLALVRLEA